MADLTGVEAKLSRAEEHFNVFRGRLDDLRRANVSYAKQEYNEAAGQFEWSVIDDWTIPSDIPLIVGDCLHNARSCLDHLAWQLARRPSHRTGFPIFKSARDFGCYAPSQMQSMRPGAKAAIERLQPYTPDDGVKPLGWLHDLDIIDKHRLVLVTAMQAMGGAFTGEGLPRGVHADFTQRPFHRGAIFMVARMPFDPDVRINYLPVAEVAFADPPMLHRVVEHVLLQIMDGLRKRVLPAFSPGDFP